MSSTARIWLAALATAGLAAALGGLTVARWPEPSPPDPLVTLRADPVARPAPPPGARSLVLVVGCTVRADQTTPWGGPPSTTPFLARLAASGARLDDLVTAAPWTRPASTAILTGHHALGVGMADPAPGNDELRLPDEVVTLAEHLRDRGWHTIGLTTNPNLNDTYGFRQGFDTWRQLARLWREDGTKLAGTEAVADALRLLDEDAPRGPFFLLVVLVDAHAPHDAPPEELAAQADPSVPPQVVAYRASLRRFDDAVAALHEGLGARGHGADDTVFAVANDHGDGLGWPRHAGRSHGRFLGPSSVAGVLVVEGPAIPAGRVVQGVSSQIDLAPTLASLVGAPGMPAEGRDLSGVILEGGRTGEDAAFTDTWFQDVDRAAIYTDDEACQRSFSGAASPSFADGCFDRRADPTEAHPLPPDATMDRLVRWREAHAGAPLHRVTPDPAVQRQLRDLGYVEGAPGE